MFIFLPAIILPKTITLFGGRVLGYWIQFCLKTFLSVKIEVKGLENIPRNKNFLLHLFINLYLKHFFANNIQKSSFYFKKTTA